MGGSKVIKGLVFDLDGTLYDLKIDRGSLNEALTDKLGHGFTTYDEVFAIAAESSGSLLELIDGAELHGVEAGVAMPGVEQALPQLRSYALAVVTRNSRAATEAALEKLGLQGIVTVCREDVVKLKPHPEALELALQRLQLRPAEVLMIGDTSHDVGIARSCQVSSIIIKNPALAFIPDGADYYLESMAELPAMLGTIE